MTLRRKRIDQGLCIDCGDLRGTDGTATRCAADARKVNQKQASRIARLRRRRKKHNQCTECGEQLTGKGTLCPVHLLLQLQADRRYRRRQDVNT